MVALAWLYGPRAPVPEFMPISSLIGPLTKDMPATALELLPRVEGLRQPLDHFLHDGPPRDGIRAVDVRAKLGRRLAHDGLGHEGLAKPGHAVDRRHRADHPIELVRVHGDRGDAVRGLYRHRVRGDRRRAGASVANAEDRGVSLRANLFPGDRIVDEIND